MAKSDKMKIGKAGKKNKMVGKAEMSLDKGGMAAKTAPMKKMA